LSPENDPLPKSTSLTPGLTLASRYRIDEVVVGEGLRPSYRGVDLQTTSQFCAIELSLAEQGVVTKLRELQHPNIAKILDVIPQEDGSCVLISERVLGQTVSAYVRQHMEEHERAPVDGVRLVLRLADALSHAHALGACHGSIGPLSVLAVPEGRPGPVLTVEGWPLSESPFFVGGKRGEEAPSEAGDTWAVACLLHYVLSGAEPNPEGVHSVEELHRLGILDPPLTDALLAGLNANQAQRALVLKPIKRDLARWFVDHAADEPVSSGMHSSTPPPLPSPSSPAIVIASVKSERPQEDRVSLSPAPKTARGLAAWGFGALAVGILGALAFSSMMGRPQSPEPALPSPAPEVAAVPTQKGLDLTEVPVMGAEQAQSGNPTASCVSGYLPKGAFANAPNLEWLCTEPDPRKGADRLRSAIVAGAPTTASDAMRLFGRLGWYDMAAYAVVRAGCCGEGKTLELPKPSQKCGDMGQALTKLGHSIMANGEVEQALEAYASSVQCEISAGRAKEFKHEARVDGGEVSTFRELIRGALQP